MSLSVPSISQPLGGSGGNALPLEGGDGPFQQIGALPERAERADAHVAPAAEQAADGTAGVVVIDGEVVDR
jgi:hypothetical protein